MAQEKKYNAIITAVGMYFPEKVYDNKYFESIVETNEDWILTRTGIRERRILEKGGTSVLATNAALDLIKKHNVKPGDIDCIIVATVTPDICFSHQQLASFKKELVLLTPGVLISKLLVQVFYLLSKLAVH